MSTALKHRCRNLRCRTKLEVPTSNEHKAFCKPYCYDQFYKRRCRVCEKPLSEGHRRQLCLSRECARDWRNFRPTYTFDGQSGLNCTGDARSACAAGGKTGLKARIDALRAPATARIIARPPLSDFSLWAATLDPPKPARAPIDTTRWHRQPGELAAEWTAREWARREADDAQYVKEDEERLRTAPLDGSGNYAPMPRCTDCRIDVAPCVGATPRDGTWEWYMVRSHVWAASGMKPDGGFLCIGCLEERIGRQLGPADFASVPVNTDHPLHTPRLRSRLRGTP
jgi:hypothetical protein